MGDTQFHFRVRCSGEGAGGTGLMKSTTHYGAPLVLMVHHRSTIVMQRHHTLSFFSLMLGTIMGSSTSDK